MIATAATGARTNLGTRNEEGALRLLVKAFDRISPRNIVATMRMSLDNPRDRQTVQVQIAKDGRQRVEVVEPLQQSGVVIVEDGDTRMIYNRDKHTLSVGRSMTADLFEPSERLRLVRKNYTVTLIRNVEMANRKVVRIDAMSRYTDVGGARIFIDPTSFFVMGVDAVDQSAHVSKRFDTIAVSYPEDMPDSTFDVTVDAKRIREIDPVPVKSVGDAARKAGFRPLGPRELPYGFALRKIYIRIGSEYSTISFNLSDGLAAATVFEYNLSKCP